MKPIFRIQLKTLPNHPSGGRKTLTRLHTNELRLVMVDSMRDYMKEVKRTAQRKVSGEVLNRRTGRLFRSIRERVFSREAKFRIIGRIGSNVTYARIHEFGGRIRVTPKMRAKLHSIGSRRGEPSPEASRAGRGTRSGIHLRSSTQFIKIPKRSYLRTSFQETQAFGTRLIQQRIRRYIHRRLN